MNSILIKLYGFFAVASLLAIAITGTLVHAQEKKTTLTEREQTRVVNLAANMTNRTDAMSWRLQNIADRLKFAQGWMKEYFIVDYSQFIEKMTTFDELTKQNEEILQKIDAEVYNAATSANPKKDWAIVKNQYIKMQSNQFESLKILTESFNILFEIVNTGQAPSAPSTSTTTKATTTDDITASSSTNI